jgi:hypothetical protein
MLFQREIQLEEQRPQNSEWKQGQKLMRMYFTITRYARIVQSLWLCIFDKLACVENLRYEIRYQVVAKKATRTVEMYPILREMADNR